MVIKRAFISFDYDHDEDLRNLLAGQANVLVHRTKNSTPKKN